MNNTELSSLLSRLIEEIIQEQVDVPFSKKISRARKVLRSACEQIIDVCEKNKKDPVTDLRDKASTSHRAIKKIVDNLVFRDVSKSRQGPAFSLSIALQAGIDRASGGDDNELYEYYRDIIEWIDSTWDPYAPQKTNESHTIDEMDTRIGIDYGAENREKHSSEIEKLMNDFTREVRSLYKLCGSKDRESTKNNVIRSLRLARQMGAEESLFPGISDSILQDTDALATAGGLMFNVLSVLEPLKSSPNDEMYETSLEDCITWMKTCVSAAKSAVKTIHEAVSPSPEYQRKEELRQSIQDNAIAMWRAGRLKGPKQLNAYLDKVLKLSDNDPDVAMAIMPLKQALSVAFFGKVAKVQKR